VAIPEQAHVPQSKEQSMWVFNQLRAGGFRQWSGGVALWLAFCTPAIQAAQPVVEFDIAQTAACRLLPAADSAKLHPNSNVVEVVFDLSTRIVAGSEADIKRVNVEIRSPNRQLTLIGFTPNTTLLSESVDGVIEIEEHKATGQISVEYGMPSAKIQASANNTGNSKIVEKKFAPKSLVVSSGTIDRSHGVFFTLHPSNQDSLQKSRQFVCQFAVPPSFRADYIQITCTALASSRGVVRSLDTETTAGLARYTIGIYLDGDSDAHRAADRLAERQQELFNQVQLHSAELVRRGESHHWWDAVGKTVMNVSTSMSSPKNTPPWLASQLLIDLENNAAGSPLPAGVARAERAVQLAKRSVRRLNVPKAIQ
jgi:hypothetical protein